ncbi:DUF3486 family protein [Brytella acorum]|uniref:DUF3486 family protein n=1 Tax=Brytella acorum TaxID=2959299 RepID=A0AA35UFX1_9PROT|nr:DUF3486 family protein [Brytella acorum]CAI9120460.1 DUF3486 family protein [Brytella acorum]
MGRPSSIDRLPPEIRELINRLRDKGHTIDEIMRKLGELEVVQISRSSVGRYVKARAKIGERLQRTRVISEALIRERGNEPPSRTARLNIELLQTAIFDIFGLLDEGSDEAVADQLKNNPKAIHDIAKAMDHLTRSSRNDLDYERELEASIRAKLATEARSGFEQEAKRQGLSADTVSALMAGAFGVKKDE